MQIKIRISTRKSYAHRRVRIRGTSDVHEPHMVDDS